MGSLKDVTEIEFQRASIISQERFSARPDLESMEPKDKYYFVHLVFFFFGLGSFLSVPFFITANDYWMYKFRDVAQATYNSSNRTDLQSYFASSVQITQSVPAVLTQILATMFGHKIHIRSRMMSSVFTLVLMYGLFTVFVKVDTDSWQTEFFILTLICYVLLTIASAAFSMVGMNLVSRFPHKYLKFQMYGQGAAGMASAVLQIISLSIEGSTTTRAMFYFSAGALILLTTFILSYFTDKSPLFRYYLGDTAADIERPVYTTKEMKDVALMTWPVYVVVLSVMATTQMGHPNITSLVVSENYDKGNYWNDIYFVPVITFLLNEVFGLVGRALAGPYITRKRAIPFVVVHLLRLAVFAPIFMFCNAQPRSHLPVWFPHDWEYILLVIINSITGAFFLASGFLSVKNLAGSQVEVGFLVLSTVGAGVGALFSLLGPVYVKML